jgi:hypothetical protein
METQIADNFLILEFKQYLNFKMRIILLNKTNNLIYYFIIALVLLIILSPVFSIYGFSDDYFTFYNSKRHLFDYKNFGISGGRYFIVMLQVYLFKIIDRIEDLRYLRLFGLLLSFFLTSYLFWFFTHYVFKTRFISFIFSISIITLPTYLLYNSWTILCVACIPVFFSIIVFHLVLGQYKFILEIGNKIFSKKFTAKRGIQNLVLHKKSLVILILSFLLNIIILNLGQYIALYSLFLLTAIVLRHKKITKQTLQFGYFYLFFIVISLIFYFLTYKLQLYYFNIQPDPRAMLVKDITGKFFWFLHVIRDIIKFNTLLLPSKLTTLLFYIYIILLVVWVYKLYTSNRKTFFFILVFTLSVVLLSYSSNLIVAENWPTVRTYAVLAPVLFLILFLSIRSFFTNYLQTPLISILFIIHLSLAFYNLKYGFVKPQIIEYRLLTERLKNQNRDFVFIQPDYDIHSNNTRIPRNFDEFQMPSLAQPWVPEPLINTILLHENKKLNFKVIPYINKDSADVEGYEKIDFNEILNKYYKTLDK